MNLPIISTGAHVLCLRCCHGAFHGRQHAWTTAPKKLCSQDLPLHTGGTLQAEVMLEHKALDVFPDTIAEPSWCQMFLWSPRSCILLFLCLPVLVYVVFMPATGLCVCAFAGLYLMDYII